jgi:photosystem II stability/assembly factor-like uncharacterized protein
MKMLFGTGLKATVSMIFAAARVYGSDPLDTWHVRAVPAATGLNLDGVAYGNGRWVIVGQDGIILSSTDGLEWQSEVNPNAPKGLEDVLFANGMFVAFGTQSNNLLTSTDGQHWTPQTPNFSGAFEMVHDGTRFVSVVAGSFVVASTNGVNWANLPRCAAQYDIGGVAYGNGIYVEAGYKRTGTPPDLYMTTDLKGWTQQDSKVTQNLMNVGFGLGMFVAVGQKGAITTSPDGINWTAQKSAHTGFIWDVATDGKTLVAAAQWGRMLTSTDGANWKVHETDLVWHMTDVAYGNGTFVAVGWEGQIVQSDPVVTAPPSGEIRLTNPTKTGPFEFQLKGEAGTAYTIQGSADLKTWTPVSSVTAGGPSTPVTDGSISTQRFYRAVKQ